MIAKFSIAKIVLLFSGFSTKSLLYLRPEAKNAPTQMALNMNAPDNPLSGFEDINQKSHRSKAHEGKSN